MSNFDIDELAELLAMARIKPALVQRHSDPLSADAATQALCRLAGVQYQVPQARTHIAPACLTSLKEGQVTSQWERAGHGLGMWMQEVISCKLQCHDMYSQRTACSGALTARLPAAKVKRADSTVGGPAHMGSVVLKSTSLLPMASGG